MLAAVAGAPAVLAALAAALSVAALVRAPARRPGQAGAPAGTRAARSQDAAPSALVQRRRIGRTLTVGAGLVGALALVGPVGGVVALAGAPLIGRWRSLRARRRATRRAERAVPELIDVLVVAVRGGFTPALAFELLADL